MVLRLKTRESRSLPGLRNATTNLISTSTAHAETKGRPKAVLRAIKDHNAEQNNAAGWSSPVARQAHNLKAAGSNPAPATKSKSPRKRAFFVRKSRINIPAPKPSAPHFAPDRRTGFHGLLDCYRRARDSPPECYNAVASPTEAPRTEPVRACFQCRNSTRRGHACDHVSRASKNISQRVVTKPCAAA